MKINAIYKLAHSRPIYLSTGPKNWKNLPVSEEKGIMFCHPMWFFGFRSVPLYKRLARELKGKNISLVLLQNSMLENVIGTIAGFKTYLANQNMHADETEFCVKATAPKEFDAVYVAAAAPYKRIHLALTIKDLFVVTYFWPDLRNDNGKWDLRLLNKRLAHVNHNDERISREEVGAIINKAHCGLALSRIEGAMWAVQEYLLCGIPVVTTRNLGGRGHYLNANNSVVVCSTPKAVRQGVEDLKSKNFDPELIRSNVLNEMKRNRDKFCDIVTRHVNLDDDEKNYLNNIWYSGGLEKIRLF